MQIADEFEPNLAVTYYGKRACHNNSDAKVKGEGYVRPKTELSLSLAEALLLTRLCRVAFLLLTQYFLNICYTFSLAAG